MTLNDKLEHFFKASPGTWIDGRELAHVAGYAAWRTRVSDLRKRGLTIENRQSVRQQNDQRWTLSEYRYIEKAGATA